MLSCIFFFFFNNPSTTEIYTLSLHDALPISLSITFGSVITGAIAIVAIFIASTWIIATIDRKSTRLNSSHTVISYAVFCLKKKKKIQVAKSVATIHTKEIAAARNYTLHLKSI